MFPTLTLFSTEINMGAVMGNLALLSFILYNFLCLKKKKNLLGVWSNIIIDKNKRRKTPKKLLTSATFFAVIETVILTYGQDYPVGFTGWFGSLIGDGSANYFGCAYFAPIVFVLFCFLVAVDPLEQIDMYAPSYALMLIFAKIQCFCVGCCTGVEWSGGMYNHMYKTNMFPVQIVEAGLALIVFIFLQWYKKRAKKGTVFPMFLILYSATRFFSEFWRIEPNVLGILKTYHILCLIGVALGIIEFVVAVKYGDKISAFFSGIYTKIYDKHTKKKIVHKKKH